MGNSKFALGNKIIDQLIKHGIADQETQRVIIDIPVDGFPIVYVQKIATNSVFDIVTLLGGAQIGEIISHTKVVTFEKSELGEHLVGRGGNPDGGHWPAQGHGVVIPDEH